MNKLKGWIRDWFYVPKYEKVSDKSFSQIMLSSVLGILICGIFLAGITWAWFTGSVTSTANNITAAKFSVQITFKQNGLEIEPETDENGYYKLNDGSYTVTVTADGDASTGFCRVELKLPDNSSLTYHTVQIYPAEAGSDPQNIEFTVNASDGYRLSIIPQWGTYSKPDNDEVLIGNSTEDIEIIPISSLTLSAAGTEESQTYNLTESEQSYTVQQGDTLSSIAGLYGTTAAVLTAYNNMQNPDEIQVGATVKIPPVSYTIPE